MCKISAGVLRGEILAEKKMTLLISADTAYRVEKSFLRFGLRGCYVVDLHGRMNSCRLVILKKLKKFENYFNKSLRGWFFRLIFAAKF